MKKIVNVTIIIISLLGLAFLQGCATLNKTECQTANWEIIGLEDGSNGRSSAFIGEHRKACADYGISPNLEVYLRGHKKGLKQYCNYNNGYALGERGSSYNQACSQTEFDDFYQGYQRGAKAYGYISDIRQLKGALSGAFSRLDEIEHSIKHKEDQVLAEETSRQVKRDLLEEIKSLNSESAEIRIEIPLLEADLYQAEMRYERFRQQR